jgi:hypothetical protein
MMRTSIGAAYPAPCCSSFTSTCASGATAGSVRRSSATRRGVTSGEAVLTINCPYAGVDGSGLTL